jgi:superfamily I DNA and/or RNA helicase
MDYFKNLLDLLKIERQEDRLQYQLLTEKSSVADRRANGLTWYPIAIRGSEMSQGDYITVEVERTSHLEISHQLRYGMPAVFFGNHDPQNDRVEGVIAYLSGNRLKITLKTDELPDWARDGKLGIDLLFDDNSYDEMNQALKQAEVISASKTSLLRDVLIGNKKPTFNTEFKPHTFQGLNISQQAAVNQILSANELAIVHGPPGTGKTTTLVHAIKALIVEQHKQILVCAPSNTAVDLLSEKLHAEGINVLRVGNPARVNERLMSLTLDSKMQEHGMIKDIKKLKKHAQEYKNMAHKYKRNFGPEEREQRKLLMNEAHKIMKEVGNTEQYIINDLVSNAQVITSTLVGANNYMIRNLTFDTLIIDEAGQALEPSCWIPILKANKLILAGDHCQLPPTVKSNEAAKRGLNFTLLEKNVSLHPEAVILLSEQYRMNSQIMGYSSNVFYHNQLQAHISVADRVLYLHDQPLNFIDTAGCGFDEKLDGTSTTNPEEAGLLLKHLMLLINELSTHYSIDHFPSIGIIAPYKQQMYVIKEQLENFTELKVYSSFININTVDSFQGQERDIIYISMTRSNDRAEIGFLSDIRRMNVAMTRARKKLVIVGDSATLGQHQFYADFIVYAEKLDSYKSAWEFM